MTNMDRPFGSIVFNKTVHIKISYFSAKVKSWLGQIPSVFHRAWERGDNLAKSKRFPLLLLVSRSLRSSPFACHATAKERRTPWTEENVKFQNHLKSFYLQPNEYNVILK